MSEFVLPGAADHTVVVGPTGSGKTVAGAWILSKQRFDKRPWVCLDFKDEELWDMVGEPAMRPLKLGTMPGKTGLYRMHVDPGQEDELEAWLWNVWRRGNIGLFADEASLIKSPRAFKAILRQGRSKRIPTISCTQRPVDVDREVFSESTYKMIFPLHDKRDYQIVKGFVREAPIEKPILDQRGRVIKHASYWYDAKQHSLFTLQATPKPEIIASQLREAAPPRGFWG